MFELVEGSIHEKCRFCNRNRFFSTFFPTISGFLTIFNDKNETYERDILVPMERVDIPYGKIRPIFL